MFHWTQCIRIEADRLCERIMDHPLQRHSRESTQNINGRFGNFRGREFREIFGSTPLVSGSILRPSHKNSPRTRIQIPMRNSEESHKCEEKKIWEKISKSGTSGRRRNWRKFDLSLRALFERTMAATFRRLSNPFSLNIDGMKLNLNIRRSNFAKFDSGGSASCCKILRRMLCLTA